MLFLRDYSLSVTVLFPTIPPLTVDQVDQVLILDVVFPKDYLEMIKMKAFVITMRSTNSYFIPCFWFFIYLLLIVSHVLDRAASKVLHLVSKYLRP